MKELLSYMTDKYKLQSNHTTDFCKSMYTIEGSNLHSRTTSCCERSSEYDDDT